MKLIQDSAEGLDKTSNFGTLDIISALEWTQRNISSFGGQMSNVTVFGESAGGHNIYALLASPLADGLFHKAIAPIGLHHRRNTRVRLLTMLVSLFISIGVAGS